MPRELTGVEAQAYAIIKHSSRIPAQLRESIRAQAVIHRFISPCGTRLSQVHAWFWHVPTRPLRPGLMARGADIPRDFTATPLGPIHDHEVYLGEASSSDARRIASALHDALIREAGFTATPISVIPDLHDLVANQRVFLVVSADRRAIAFATVGRASGLVLICRADANGPIKAHCQFSPVPEGRRLVEVEAVWVAREFRGRGLAADLIRFIAGYFKIRPCDMAYRSVFTAGGFATIYRAAGHLFPVTGEVLRLDLLEQAPRDLLEPHASFDAEGLPIHEGARP